MGLELDYIDGQTPLDEDEKEGLRILTIATREELDEFEQQNIEEAILWILNRKLTPETILTEDFIKRLHKRMLGNVWDWAGTFRKTNKNLGVDKWQISSELRALVDDTRFWVNNETFPPEEIAIRFKHRLVSIHCFPNGNGRHSRLMADIIISHIYNKPMFPWGADNLAKSGDLRSRYLKAVKIADRGNYVPLIAFAQS